MPFFGFFTFVIVAAVAWYWRLKMLREAGSEVIDSVERMRGAYKRRQFRKKAEEAPIAAIKDPAIAAVTFFFALANENPMQKDAATNLIRRQMSGIIRANDMDEVLIFSDWVAKNVIHPKDPVRRFGPLWLEMLSVSERSQLLAITEEICDLGENRTIEQNDALQALKKTLFN